MHLLLLSVIFIYYLLYTYFNKILIYLLFLLLLILLFCTFLILCSEANICYHIIILLFSFSRKLQASGLQLYWKETSGRVFSCEFCEIYKNILFTEHFRTTALTHFFQSLPVLSKAVARKSSQTPKLCLYFIFWIVCINYKLPEAVIEC